MLKSKLIVALLVMAIILSCFAVSVSAAPYAQHSSKNFGHLGGAYIYSNNPQSISSSIFTPSAAPYGKYTINQSLTINSQYTANFYHWNNCNVPLKMGVAIINTSAIPKSVQVFNNSSIGTASSPNEIAMTSNVEYSFFSNGGSSFTTVQVPARIGSTGGVSVILSTDVTPNMCANGRIKFIPLSDGLYAQVFYFNASKDSKGSYIYYTPANVYNINLSSAETPDVGRTTACFASDVRQFGTDVGDTFYLNMYQLMDGEQYNFYEYENGINSISGPNYYTDHYLLYNFGIEYRALLPSSTHGRTVKITPYWGSGKAEKDQTIFFKNGSNPWQTITIPYGSDKLILLLGDTFNYVLPSANYGDVKFEIIQ